MTQIKFSTMGRCYYCCPQANRGCAHLCVQIHSHSYHQDKSFVEVPGPRAPLATPHTPVAGTLALIPALFQGRKTCRLTDLLQTGTRSGDACALSHRWPGTVRRKTWAQVVPRQHLPGAWKQTRNHHLNTAGNMALAKHHVCWKTHKCIAVTRGCLGAGRTQSCGELHQGQCQSKEAFHLH